MGGRETVLLAAKFNYARIGTRQTLSGRSFVRRHFRLLLTSTIDSPRHWGVILAVALAFTFLRGLDYSDWRLNTGPLRDGLAAYQHEEAVYPPWDLLLLWPYYFLTGTGSRVASVLVVGWLAARCGWSLMRFFAVVFAPPFIWTMRLSNLDVLALLLPVLLWETAEGSRRQSLGRGLALTLLLVKPQGAFLLLAYLVWTHRRPWRMMMLHVMLVLLITVPISLIGNPPLLLQWMDNLQHPSAENQGWWRDNNISLTADFGLGLACLITVSVFLTIYAAKRWRGRVWTLNHTYAVLLMVSMLLSPYASSQSAVAALALLSSAPAFTVQYVVYLAGAVVGAKLPYDAIPMLLLMASGLWFYESQQDVSARQVRRRALGPEPIAAPGFSALTD